MSNTKYKLLKDRVTGVKGEFTHTAGITLYPFTGHDYGMARYDQMRTGVHHVAVTLNENGDGPFFTVPQNDIKEIKPGLLARLGFNFG